LCVARERLVVGFSAESGRGDAVEFSWNEVTGAIGDSVTVLPLVAAVGLLTDLSVAVVLVWFGVFQVVWGLYYGAPVSVEPMKALAALLLAGAVETGEFLLAGLALGAGLLLAGATGTLARLSQYVGSPVVRGVQFGVALVLLETGLGLAAANLRLAGLGAGVALLLTARGRSNLTPVAVLVVGGVVAVRNAGVPAPALPSLDGVLVVGRAEPSLAVAEAAAAQSAMTVGNAALAASVLLADYFDRDVSPDRLAGSMGVMNLVAVPLGALPMCHGSGGIAGKHAFGARTAGANVVLGVGYLLVALLAADLVAAYPPSVLGVVLGLVAVSLGRTSVARADEPLVVVVVGVLGLVAGLGVAFLAGTAAYALLRGTVSGDG
jgi:hypothetical protein